MKCEVFEVMVNMTPVIFANEDDAARAAAALTRGLTPHIRGDKQVYAPVEASVRLATLDLNRKPRSKRLPTLSPKLLDDYLGQHAGNTPMLPAPKEGGAE